MRALVGLLVLAICTTAPAQTSRAPQNSAASAHAEIEADGCLDRKAGRFELTNAFWWVVYYLTGQTAGLENHIGDEAKIRGTETSPEKPSEPSTPWNRVPPTLQVTSVEILTHKNPEGVRPVLGRLDTWVSYDNPEYGVRLRYPATFTEGQLGYPAVKSNFAGEPANPDSSIVNVGIPKTTYPDSNYVDGTFTVFVNPKIDSEGTCKQFRTFWPEHSGSTTVNGVTYSRTIGADGVAMGTAYSGYDFHTFQNGLCYEFSFNFAEGNGGGMDIPCSIQWVSDDNSFELMRAVLSQVSFAKPKLTREASETSSPNLAPTVTSFEHGPILQQPIVRGTPIAIGISWRTANTDYVQIRYPCMNSVFASSVQPPSYGLGTCGDSTDVNLPPNGSMSLLLNNFTSGPIKLVFTIEPFRAGVGYPKESKTISIPVSPRSPIQGK